MSCKLFFSCSSSIEKPGSMFVFENKDFKIIKLFSKIFPFFPIWYAISTASSVLKYIDNCSVESDVSKSLCFSLISSGIDEPICVDIFCVASSFVKPDISIPLMEIPCAIVLLFVFTKVNVINVISAISIKMNVKIPKIVKTFFFFCCFYLNCCVFICYFIFFFYFHVILLLNSLL